MPGIKVPATVFRDGSAPSQFHCVSCKLLLREPVQSTCGHRFCKSCADEIIAKVKSTPQCPECQEEFEEEDGVQYFPDRFVKREINNLVVICPFSELGCNWEGVFREYQEHVSGCDFATTTCEYCSKEVSRNQLESHRQFCPQAPKQCPLAAIGCTTTTFNSEQLKQHMEEAHSEHFARLMEHIKTTEMKVEGTVAESQERACDLVEADGPSSLVGHDFKTGQSLLKERGTPCKAHFVARLQDVGPPSAGVQSLLQEEMESLQEEIRKSMTTDLRQRDNDLDQIRTSVTKLEKTVKAKNAEFEDRDFRLSLIENSNHDGSMIWKIPQFSQRKADAENGKYTSIFSLPFYSGRYGYKMCLRLYIMGDGIGKGTHLSLFFVVMRGEFDNILQWPFTHKVTFKLINQAGGRDIVDSFQPDPMSSSFRKPRSDMNIASGCPRFVSHTELERGGFIVDDTVFIKCMIDTSTILHP